MADVSCKIDLSSLANLESELRGSSEPSSLWRFLRVLHRNLSPFLPCSDFSCSAYVSAYLAEPRRTPALSPAGLDTLRAGFALFRSRSSSSFFCSVICRLWTCCSSCRNSGVGGSSSTASPHSSIRPQGSPVFAVRGGGEHVA